MQPQRTEAVTRDRLVWLFDSRRPEKRSSASEADIAIACQFAQENWQLLPVILPRLRAWAGHLHAESEGIRRTEDLTVAVRILSAVQMRLCRRFTDELALQKIPYSLLKGTASRVLAYPTVTDRCGLDVDIGVPRHFLQRAEEIALNLGFLPASLDETRRHFFVVDSAERSEIEQQHYELVCLVRRQVVQGLTPDDESAIRRSIDSLKPWHVTDDGRLCCYVTLDIHHGLSLDIAVDDLVRTSRRVKAGQYNVSVPSLSWTVFHLIFKIYWEGVHSYRKGGYQFADLLRTVPMLDESETSKVVALINEYQLEAAAFYVLRRLSSEFGMKLSVALEKLVTAAAIPPIDQFPNDVNDLGDMWPKLWGHR